MYSASNGLINIPGDSNQENYFFAGWSYGFETQYQSLTPDSYPQIKNSTELDYDVYVYKFNFYDDYTSTFLYQEEINQNDMSRRLTKTNQA